MALLNAVNAVFAPGGALAGSVPEFNPRAGQLQMAQAVAHTVESGGVLVVEAGTGIGKTYAYLVPALLSGARVVVSTATKALQDQLFGRDIPKLVSVLGVQVRIALLKGRGSYLCLDRLGSARHASALQRPADLQALAQVEIWATATRAGDLSELASLEEQSAVWPLVTSTRDNCTGARCPAFQGCHVYKARREAMAADVVVINHHLFFADWNVKESGVAELLPTVDSVIFDEAHQLNEIGVQFLGQQFSTGQLASLGRDLVRVGALQARGLADWQGLVAQMEARVAELQLLCTAGVGESAKRWRWVAAAPDGIAADGWSQSFSRLQSALQDVATSLVLVSALSPELLSIHERAVSLQERLDSFGNAPPAGKVRWVESGLRLRLMESPIDIAQDLRSKVLPGDDASSRRKSWVFTSATLGHDADLQWFLASHGLDGAQVLQVQSPFDYARQASLYIPADFPKPSDPSHSAQVAHLAAEGARILGGRTLVLTTTLRAMRTIGKLLREWIPASYGIDVLVQGEGAKRDLMERFNQSNVSGKPGCVLVASASFWEGFDVPGDALQLVLIDKIPFAPPDDPLVEARCQVLAAQGKNAFAHYQLPMAAVALKQGVGRLIRNESDRGVMVLCDVRLQQMGYGRKLLAGLPPMRRLEHALDFRQALEALTTSSTTDLNLSSPPW